MQDHKLYGYLMGQALYKDIIDGAEHKTEFCLEYLDVHIDQNEEKPTLSFNLTNVGAHNCADDDCPKQ